MNEAPDANIPFPSLLEELAARFALGTKSCHGPAHWKRVEKNGLLLAPHTGADPVVIRFFALFHDSCRMSEAIDPGHGGRGADLALRYRGKGAFSLDDRRMELLVEACRNHTDVHLSVEATIGTCWDADRLDLARIEGFTPDPHYLSTARAREAEVIAAAVKRTLAEVKPKPRKNR